MSAITVSVAGGVPASKDPQAAYKKMVDPKLAELFKSKEKVKALVTIDGSKVIIFFDPTGAQNNLKGCLTFTHDWIVPSVAIVASGDILKPVIDKVTEAVQKESVLGSKHIIGKQSLEFGFFGNAFFESFGFSMQTKKKWFCFC